MRLEPSTLTWLCDQVQPVSETTRQILRLRYCEGLGFQSISAETKITDFSVRKRISRFWAKVHRHEADVRDAAYLADVLASVRDAEVQIGATITEYEEAKVILNELRGPVPHNPPAPTWDERGTRVGCHPQLVTVPELARHIRKRNAVRVLQIT